MAEGSEGVSAAATRGERLTRADRLLLRPEYKRVYAGGRRAAGRWIVLFALENGGATSRLGITATRRTGGATVRNLMRRRLKEIYRRTVRPALEAEGLGVDLVANLRDGAPDAPFADLSAEFLRLCRRAAEGARRPGGGGTP